MPAPKRRTIDPQWSAADIYPNRAGQTSREIRTAVEHLYPTQPFGTHGSAVADLILFKLIGNERAQANPRAWRDHILAEVKAERSDMVGRVLVYSFNNRQTGRREPKSASDQAVAFRRNLFAAWRDALVALERLTSGAESAAEGQASGQAINPAPVEAAPVEAEPVEAEPVVSVGSNDPLRAHVEWHTATQAIMAESGEHLSLRPLTDGLALIAAGCRSDVIRDAILLDYSDDLRDRCGIRGPVILSSVELEDYLSKACAARVLERDGSVRPVNLALVGPAGIGKTTAIKALAERDGGRLYSVDMSAGTPLSAFYGTKFIDGSWSGCDFERWARNGGKHLFGEIDCSDPNLLKVLNKALANREYTNPVTGDTIKLHPDAIAIADSNTLGTGTQGEYSAAEQLDFSTVDRFRPGRIRCTLDKALQSRIAEAQIAHHESASR